MTDKAHEIAARWAAATPGPWRFRRNSDGTSWNIETELPCINGLRAWLSVAHIHWDAAAEFYTDGRLDPEADATAIAAAPDDIAWLLAERERLREALTWAIDQIEGRTFYPGSDQFTGKEQFENALECARAALGEQP